ncbi:DUF4189 domain-containing protein [Xanthomonas theicola]|uniref:DUF4189 domain-containing protein n=1 Tax=Xanthomonas theicola TaxID=56464 RepID=A0A2S6Z347_9XANT|nr:DUF4189 domain-containing protein [Xanthomonas theicola]PPT75439.1 hypothetical protein XthCFBP4691_19755 [Xanthomonas theicola]QNH24267.1 DUF4189 domain-containing protein [Xanthomonas theicola]
MTYRKLLCCVGSFLLAGNACAEGACPPGQYPIGGQGAVGCAPIPQNQSIQQAPRPTGRWIETWGAIAMGSIDSINSYGVTTGKLSKSEAESDALRRCASHGETNCQIGVAYKNQCAAIAEPQMQGKTFDGGGSTFAGEVSIPKASEVALERCKKANANFSVAACKIIYTACTEQIFERY